MLQTLILTLLKSDERIKIPKESADELLFNGTIWNKNIKTGEL